MKQFAEIFNIINFSFIERTIFFFQLNHEIAIFLNDNINHFFIEKFDSAAILVRTNDFNERKMMIK